MHARSRNRGSRTNNAKMPRLPEGEPSPGAPPQAQMQQAVETVTSSHDYNAPENQPWLSAPPAAASTPQEAAPQPPAVADGAEPEGAAQTTKRRRKKTGATPASEPKAPDGAQGSDEAAPVAEHDYNAPENNSWAPPPAAAPPAQAASEPAASPVTSLAPIAGAAAVAETTKKRRKKRAPADDAVRV